MREQESTGPERRETSWRNAGFTHRFAMSQGLSIALATLVVALWAAGARADTFKITFYNVTFSAPCIGGTGTCTEVINGGGLYDPVMGVATDISISMTGSLNASLDAYGAPACTGPLCLDPTGKVLYDAGALAGYNPIEFSPTLPTFDAPTPEPLRGGPDGTGLFVPRLCGGDQPLCGAKGAFPGGADYELTSGTYTSVDVSPTETPEPVSLLLIGTGLLGFGALALRRRRGPKFAIFLAGGFAPDVDGAGAPRGFYRRAQR